MFELTTIIAIILALAILGIVAIAASRPDTFKVQRTVSIKARPEQIYPLIASLRAMNTWNPFVAPDPTIKVDYTGPESGKGAAHTWAGNSKVGEGRFEIIDAAPPSKVTMMLDMVKPMAAHNTVEFTLQPAGDATTVTWAMSGRQPLMAKVMTLFIDCDKMVGSQFDKGLAGLKAIAER